MKTVKRFKGKTQTQHILKYNVLKSITKLHITVNASM